MSEVERLAQRIAQGKKDADRFRQIVERNAADAEEDGLFDLAAGIREARNNGEILETYRALDPYAGEPSWVRGHMDWLEAMAIEKPPDCDPYLGGEVETFLGRGPHSTAPAAAFEISQRLDIIGDRPGRLIDTVRTEVSIMGRHRPELAAEAFAVLDRLDPSDRSLDGDLILVRQALGRCVSLGWPTRKVAAAVRRLKALAKED